MIRMWVEIREWKDFVAGAKETISGGLYILMQGILCGIIGLFGFGILVAFVWCMFKIMERVTGL